MEGKPYAYRGFLLDCARHFMPARDVCRLIEAAAKCGMNHMHWHLVDDQGWRVEIKRYPRLTQVGAVRGKTDFWFADPLENNCGFYTQEDIRQVVAFAREQGVVIVPEIEIPGHASAMLAAYPQYGCRRVMIDENGERIIDAPYEYKVVTMAGVFPNLICAGRDEAIRFLKDILDEIVDLFPGPYVHIGGDEAVKQHWRRCPDCQQRIRSLGLRDEDGLQRWLVLQMGAYLAEKGKKTIVWNESLDGGLLPKHFIVQHWWGNDQDTADFLASGGQVIRSDIEHYYISRMYHDLDLRGVCSAPMVPAYAKEHPENLLGMECCLWGEQITNPARAAYMLFPRLIAVAEQAKRGGQMPEWETVCALAREKMEELEKLGLRGAPEEQWAMTPQAVQEAKAQQEQMQRRPEMQDTWRLSDTILRQERLEKLLAAIRMPYPFALRVMDFAWADIPEYCGDTLTPNGDRADEMALQLLTAHKNRERGPWEKIPGDIWVDTMGCFSRFVNEHFRSTGRYAFDRQWWTTRQVNALLFRVGELEYELYKDDNRQFISLHIPSDAHLTAARLNDSVARARAFLKEYFPDWAGLPIYCESWLLSPVLPSLLPAGSNILRFQQAFDITDVETTGTDALIWVYNLTGPQRRAIDLHDLPENTTLQRNMKAYLLAGHTVGGAAGYLKRDFA